MLFIKNLSLCVLLMLLIQTNIEDDIVKTYNHLNKVYEYGFNKDFDSAKIHLKKANLFAVRSKKKELIAYVNIYKSRLLYWEAKTEEAKSELENLIANKINDTLMVKLKLLYGEIYIYEKNYKKAITSYIEIEDIVNENGVIKSKKDSTSLYKGYNNIGYIHKKLNNLKKAKKYYKKAFKFALSPNSKSLLLFMISNLYEKEENIPQALKYITKATQFASINKWQLMLPTYYSDLSKYYIKMGKGDSAVYFAKKGLENNTYCRLNWLNDNLGKGYWLKKEYSKAIHFFEVALNYTTLDESVEVHQNLRELYTETKKYKKALHQNAIYLKLKDSLDGLKIKQEVFEITEKYESEKKELKIELLNTSNENKELVIKKQEAKILIFGILLISFVILISIVIYYYKREEKKKHLLYVKNRELVKIINVNNKKKKKEVFVEGEKKNEIKNQILDLITDEFYLKKDATLTKVSKLINTNTSYLSKIINENYKKTFTNFINDLRISFILKKLESTSEYRKLTIEHLADIAGFTSVNAFYRAFKKHTGLTPSYYIKKRIEQN